MGKRKRKTKVDPLAKALGRVLTEQRKLREWSIADLASRSDQNRNNVSAHERGLMQPSLHTIRAYAYAFGVLTSGILKMAEAKL